MSESRKVLSIARRINLSWFRRLIGIFFWTDIAVLALLVAGFCFYAETSTLGSFSWETQRWFTADSSVGWVHAVRTATYHFASVAGQPHAVPMQPFTTVVALMFEYLMWAEGFLLLTQLLFGSRGARRVLKPLNKIAITAQRLSEAQRIAETHSFDETKFHNLEDAIMSLAPNRPDVKLSTGDRDLQGLENAINNLLERMHESYRQQSRFVSDASHELRTPIAVIQGYASMLDRWGKNDEMVLTESIAAIKSESEHMKKLVEQLLFLARGDSGRQKLSFERFSLSDMMREVYEESGMIDQKHSWHMEVEPDVFCVGDTDMLKQTARILTDNAAKYTPEGGAIHLRAFYRNQVPCFEVQDTGIGISREDMPHMFERFFRSDPARGSQSGGTGLGLSIAKWIVDRHMGYFKVISREGLGTRITVHLPETQFG